MEYTPGPWKVNGPMTGPRCAQAFSWGHSDFRGMRQVIHIVGKEYDDCPQASPLVAVLPCSGDVGDPDANAHLIASAPKMYEALCAVMGSKRWDCLEDPIQLSVCHALAEAEKGMQYVYRNT